MTLKTMNRNTIDVIKHFTTIKELDFIKKYRFLQNPTDKQTSYHNIIIMKLKAKMIHFIDSLDKPKKQLEQSNLD